MDISIFFSLQLLLKSMNKQKLTSYIYIKNRITLVQNYQIIIPYVISELNYYCRTDKLKLDSYYG